MKQILTAGVLALGMHGLLLGINFQWPRRISLDRSKPRALSMTLTSIPIKTTPKRKSILKAPPKKTLKNSVRSKHREVPKIIPEKTVEKTDSYLDSEQTPSKALLKADKQTAATISPLQMIHEARPLYRSNPSPKYPKLARIRGYQGNVLLDVLVNKDGKVNDLKIFRSSGYPLLDRAASSSVKHWLFEPGMIGEENVDMWVRVPIRFELKE